MKDASSSLQTLRGPAVACLQCTPCRACVRVIATPRKQAMSFTSNQQRSLRPAAQTCNQPHTAVYNSKHTTRAHQHVCQAVDPLFTLASTDPSALQDVIVGGAVTAAVGAALYSGLKQEPVPCDLCAGNGGIKCFACSGAGSSMDPIDPDILEAQAGRKLARGFVSSSSSRPGSCRVCKGKGLVLCSKCKGSGYISTF